MADELILSRRVIVERLGHLYRHERLLKRLLKLLEDAERLGLPLLIADYLPTPQHPTKGGQS